MNERGALLLSLVLSSCSVGDGGMTWPAPSSVGPADDPQSDETDDQAEVGSADSSNSGSPVGSSSGEDRGTTTVDAESSGGSTTSGGDELPADHCDPLLQTCPTAEVCVFFQDAYFKCLPDASGDYGVVGAPCQFANACNPGLFCSLGFEVACPDGGEACCTPFCDLAAGMRPCAAGSCVPYFPDGSPFAWLEDLGYCNAA